MNPAKASARYYLFEDVLWELPGFAPLRQTRPIAELQFFAGTVWAAERGRGDCPVVRPRVNRKNDVSYFLWRTRAIHLAPKHQNLAGLLHELAHALGPRDKLDHGPAFRARCTRLYKLYGGWDGNVEWEKEIKK